MTSHRLHRKVWIWVGRWWAAQLIWIPWEFGLGVWIELRRPLVDLHLLWFTVAIGRHPALTDERWKRRHSGRGFFYRGDYPRDAVL